MHQDSKRFEILAWGVPISLATMHATSRCDELTCIMRPTHPFPHTKRTRLRALLRYLFSPHPCYLLAPNTPPAPGVQAVLSSTYWLFPGQILLSNPSAEGRHDLNKHARKDEGSNLRTYLLSLTFQASLFLRLSA